MNKSKLIIYIIISTILAGCITSYKGMIIKDDYPVFTYGNNFEEKSFGDFIFKPSIIKTGPGEYLFDCEVEFLKPDVFQSITKMQFYLILLYDCYINNEIAIFPSSRDLTKKLRFSHSFNTDVEFNKYTIFYRVEVRGT